MSESMEGAGSGMDSGMNSGGGTYMNSQFNMEYTPSVSRLRFFNLILAIPLIIVAWILDQIRSLIWLLSFVVVLFSAKLPSFIYSYWSATGRFRSRLDAYIAFFIRKYPPLSFPGGSSDNGEYNSSVTYIEYEEERPRYSAFNVILAIPHLIWGIVLLIVSLLIGIVAAFSVLIGGHFPRFAYNFDIKLTNYWLHVGTFMAMMDLKYPSFSLSNYDPN